MSNALQTNPGHFAFTNGTFLDQIELRHGPAGLLGRFFLAADQAARERGVHLRLHTDMALLAQTYVEIQPGNGVPVVPTFNPSHSDLSPANSFWISGHDDSGRIVGTQAARCFDMTDSNMDRELTSLRLFYARPEPFLEAGTRCLVDCPPAREVTGRVVYSGGAWYDPKIRGRGISSILPRISRALAYGQWETDFTVSMLENVLIQKNVHQSYGYTRHAPFIGLRFSDRRPLDFEFVWMPRQEMLEDLADYTSRGLMKDVRTTEATETNRVPPRRQGSISRS